MLVLQSPLQRSLLCGTTSALCRLLCAASSKYPLAFPSSLVCRSPAALIVCSCDTVLVAPPPRPSIASCALAPSCERPPRCHYYLQGVQIALSPYCDAALPLLVPRFSHCVTCPATSSPSRYLHDSGLTPMCLPYCNVSLLPFVWSHLHLPLHWPRVFLACLLCLYSFSNAALWRLHPAFPQ